MQSVARTLGTPGDIQGRMDHEHPDAPPAATPPMTAGAPAYALQCMEVWGGNEKAEQALVVPGVDAWLYSRPYRGAAGGGDIHYVSMCAAGTIARFALADVSGHGEDVSDLALSLRSLMRKHINTPDQTHLTRALNAELGQLESEGRFATALLATYWAPSDHLIVTNAGHPRPLRFRPGVGWSLLQRDTALAGVPGIRNLPLGVIEPTEYEQFAVALAPGELIAIYTDALMEAKSPAGEQLGEPGLLGLAEQCDATDPERFARDLLALVDRHTHQAEPDDDQTLLVLHHNAGHPPRQSLRERVRVTAKMLGLTG